MIPGSDHKNRINKIIFLYSSSSSLAGPRWASWNLGVFLCIRCAGIHRNLGVHITRVKSVNLDTWTPEQVVSLQQMGNSRARAVYEAQLPDGFKRPQTDAALESFIRAKYEQKKYVAKEWVPSPSPKVISFFLFTSERTIKLSISIYDADESVNSPPPLIRLLRSQNSLFIDFPCLLVNSAVHWL